MKEMIIKLLPQKQGEAYANKLRAERDGYSTVIKTELDKRLTEGRYLTCEDFDHFDVTCCESLSCRLPSLRNVGRAVE